MNVLKFILCILLVFVASVTYSQVTDDLSSVILGRWVTTESLLTPEIESPAISSYFQYDFLPDSSLYFATHPFERGTQSVYIVAQNKIVMFDHEYSLKSYQGGQLELVTYYNWTKQTHTLTLIRKERFDSLWKLHEPRSHVEIDASTIPIFAGNVSLYNYLFSNSKTLKEYIRLSQLNPYMPLPIPPKDDIFVRMNLVIDSSGDVEILNLTTFPTLNKRHMENLHKKIQSTSGYWLPAYKTKSDSLALTFVQRGKISIELKLRALESFKKALTWYQKEDYRAALLHASEAINLDNGKFQFYILRAACQIKLNAVDKYCQDVFRARALNPFVNLINTEEVNGEILEIKCGVN